MNTTSSTRTRALVTVPLLVVTLVLNVSSCASIKSGAGTTSSPTSLGFSWPEGSAKRIEMLKPLKDNCPRGHETPATFVADDLSASSGTNGKITALRLRAMKAILTQTAVCSGSARVVAFTGSAATSTTLFDGSLKPAGHTDNARLLHVPELVDQAIATIASARTAAIKTLQQNGSAITAAYELATEYSERLSIGTDLGHVEILSDGEATSVRGLMKADPVEAAELARSLPQPDALPKSTHARISGLGQTAKKPASTTVTAALKSFYMTYCKRTGAAQCSADIEYQNRP